MTQIDTETVLDDADALAKHVAAWLFDKANASGPQFTVALSGGSTPKRLYEVLAADYADKFPWQRTHLFFGDDRFVPPDHEDSNQRMAREALISRIQLPSANFHPMPTDGDPADAARRYQGELAAHYRSDALEMERPLFDVILLGLGENGHTASLFPDTPVLDDLTDWVAPCVPHDAPHTRLTLTYPAIASSREVAFLIAGAGKREALAKVRANDRSQPASRITSIGKITWFLDRAAAG